MLVLALRLLVLVLLLLLLVLTLLVIRVLEVVLVLTPPTTHLLRPHVAHVDPAHANLVRLRPAHIYPPTSTVHRPLRASTLVAAHTPLRVHANTRRLCAT